MRRRKINSTQLLFVALVCTAGAASAQTNDVATSGRGVLADDLQRSARIFTFQQAAPSGPARGAEIYYYRCWNCHNAFTNAAGSPGPVLETLYERETLLTGDPVNDETVAEKIRVGSGLMPAFRHSMSDDDIADLVAYLKSGECCVASNVIDLPANPDFTASPDDTMRFEYRGNLSGGPEGIVRSESGDPLEGIMVQLIASENNIRTTVYSDETGSYEFPRLPTGDYTLRVARPLRWLPYRREDVHIDGAPYLDEIVLQPVTADELLPPTLDIKAQLTGAEWLMNLPGTEEEKRTFVNNCNWCHSYQQVFRSRYDESGWRNVVDRMSHYQGSTLTYRNQRGRMVAETEELLVQWLARVRGPESEDPSFKVFPGPSGPATELIVTEYELPRLYLATHDVAQDADDQLWYSPHRGAHIGRVDPATGLTREYFLPVAEGCISGTHWITVANNEVWSSQNWSHTLTRIDPDSGDLHVIRPPERLNDDGTPRECNRPMGGNWAVAPDGYIWKIRNGFVIKHDPETGAELQTWPVRNIDATYGTDVSDDGRFIGGGGWGFDWVVMLDLQTNQVIERLSGTPRQGPGRGAFDPFNNLWSGGKGGALTRLDPETNILKEFFAPVQYGSFYEANPDNNGEVWAGAVQAGRYYRLDPENEHWTTYVLPEPYSHNRKSWIDNSTSPVSVWYVDHNGYLVHLQPRR